MSTASLCYSWPLGLSNATAAIIGNQLGAGEARLAAVTAALALALCSVWGLAIGALFLFVLRPWWGSVFTDDQAVREAVQATLWVMFFYFSFDSAKCALMAVLRGCGRPMITVYGNVLSCWCVQVSRSAHSRCSIRIAAAAADAPLCWFLCSIPSPSLCSLALSSASCRCGAA